MSEMYVCAPAGLIPFWLEFGRYRVSVSSVFCHLACRKSQCISFVTTVCYAVHKAGGGRSRTPRA